ncbi:MAG: hypothetical protein C0403_19545 [Desulfobacterium sp.]|nr:hypothetical protein [Desulfobacterium sp.]
MEEIMKTILAVVCILFFVSVGIVPVEAATVNTLVLSEIFYDRVGVDNQYEWIELFNGTSGVIDLSGWSIGCGGDDYADGTFQLNGTIDPAEYLVFGGPTSDPSNGNPIYSLAMDINPDLQNSGAIADGIALFHNLASSITATTVPIFSVIYGITNSSNLIDHTGSVGTVNVGDAPAGQSIEFLAGDDGWIINPSPNPGSGSLSTVPLPSAVFLLGSGLFGFVGFRRKVIKM